MIRQLEWIHLSRQQVTDKGCRQQNPIGKRSLGGNPVEAPDREQETKPSCAESCAGEVPRSDRPDEAPDDACQDIGKTSNVRVARDEGQEVSDLGGDQAAGLNSHVEATGDRHGVQAAESIGGAKVPGRESPVEAPDWEQVKKPGVQKLLD